MKRTVLPLVILLGLGLGGCGTKEPPPPAPAPEDPGHEESVHGGCLNVIGDDLAHAEVRVEDGVFQCWFVEGGTETDKALRIAADTVELTLKFPDGSEKPLTLVAKPIELADEKSGYCSYYEAAADWLKTKKKFTATGEVHLKGGTWPLRIHYPGGHDACSG